MDTRLLLFGEESKRLLYRRLTPDDFESWLPFFSDPESTRYWAGLPANPEEACREQFDRIFTRYREGLGGMNALVQKQSGLFIGLCGLLVQWVDGEKELEIGYSILPAHRGLGFATEAARKCRDFAFKNQLAGSLISIIHVNNTASQQVAIRNGMRLDKRTTYKDNPVYIYRLTHPGG